MSHVRDYIRLFIWLGLFLWIGYVTMRARRARREDLERRELRADVIRRYDSDAVEGGR